MRIPPASGTAVRPFRFRSFVDAARGLRLLVATQPNAGVHAAASVIAGGLAACLGLDRVEWALLILSITAVWVAEGMNTAVEFVVDLVSPDYQRLAGWAKDVAAGAVLVASVGASCVGLLLFIPKLLQWWRG